MKKLILIPILILAITAKSQETKKEFNFSLEQAISYAIANNYSSINAGRDIDASKEKKWETTAMGLPQINGGLNYGNNFAFTQQGITGGGNFGGAPGEVTTIAFGTFALKALDSHWITDRQIEAARQALTREMKREGNVWIRIFPDKPITKKPAEVRMGKGKGSLEYWAAVVKPGRIIFEVDGVDEKVARASLSLAAGKLPIKTKFIVRRDLVTA